MKRVVRSIFIFLGFLIAGAVAFVFAGLYTMDIEDTYGDNQDIFYGSGRGDLVVNHDTKEIGKINKTWTRFYVTYGSDTVDIGQWWDNKNIEIYQPVDIEISETNIGYSDLERLKEEGRLVLRRRLR